MRRYIKVHKLLVSNTDLSMVVTLSLFIYNIITKFTVTAVGIYFLHPISSLFIFLALSFSSFSKSKSRALSTLSVNHGSFFPKFPCCLTLFSSASG